MAIHDTRDWQWVRAICACCRTEVIGCRILAISRHSQHSHPRLLYCIVGLQVSVN